MSARGSHISLPDVPGAAPAKAAVVPASSVAPQSFDAVYRAHAKTVSRWASRLLGPGGDCEDVVQEVFIVVRHKLPRFDGAAEITTWLYEITVRVVQDWRRRRRWWSWATGRGPEPQPRPPAGPPFAAGRGRTRSRGATGRARTSAALLPISRRARARPTGRRSSSSRWRASRASASRRSPERGWARSGSA